MSGISNDFDAKYPQVAAQIAAKYPGSKIVQANTCHYPLQKQRVRFAVTSVQKADLLEEYIMKAAMLGLSYGTDIPLLSRMLGMDEVFLSGYIESLCEKDILKKDALPALVLTDSGKKHAVSGTLPSDEIVDEIEYFIDKKSGIFYIAPLEDASCGNWEHFNLIEKYVENIKKYISRKFICSVGKALGREIEAPDGTTRITSMVSAKITGQARTLITDIRIETADGKKICLVWDHARSDFRNDLSSIIQKYSSIVNN